MTITAATLQEVLSHHQGRENGIAAAALASKCCLPSTRKLRNLISELREQGVAVCGHPTTGYYVPVTPEELAESCAFLERRAQHSLRLLANMRGLPMAELLGQMVFN
jgi:glutathione peroxidase-family protein